MPLSAADLQHLELEGWVLAKDVIPPEYIHALQVRPRRGHQAGSRRRLTEGAPANAHPPREVR